VVEGDEYDTAFFDKRPKFVHYMPDVAVIGNVEFDHADIYADLDAVKAAFRRLLTVIPRRGLLLAGIESPAVEELVRDAPCRVETFGVGGDADWRAEDAQAEAGGMRFRLLRRGRDAGIFRSGLPGLHNVRNALAALAAAEAVGVSLDASRVALGAFRGVRRRLERRGEAKGVAVYDDFAHHPTAVRETIAALRAALPGRRIVAVFEPRSYTARSRVFQDDFAAALAGADDVVVAAVHRPGKLAEADRLSEPALVEGIRARGASARFLPGVDAILAGVVPELRAGDAVLVLSNGGFGGIHEKLLAALDA
jgi:UDP-N-acetylmuramate: L-alanyl-gamma-D-glutamyl-meso-diaminopimelate ligase